MHPDDHYQPPPQQYPYYPPPPPQMVVQPPPNRAATVGVWAIFLWIAAPAILLVLCCVGCAFNGVVSTFISDMTGGVSATPTPSP